MAVGSSRSERVKNILFWGGLGFCLFAPLIAGIVGPGMAYDHVQRENPVGAKVKPWATKWMYYIGVTHSFSLNDKKAAKIWLELSEWPFSDEKGRDVDEEDLFIGYAVQDYANYLWDKRRRHLAMQYLEYFVDTWGENPKMDPDRVQRARRRMRVYNFGG